MIPCHGYVILHTVEGVPIDKNPMTLFEELDEQYKQRRSLRKSGGLPPNIQHRRIIDADSRSNAGMERAISFARRIRLDNVLPTFEELPINTFTCSGLEWKNMGELQLLFNLVGKTSDNKFIVMDKSTYM